MRAFRFTLAFLCVLSLAQCTYNQGSSSDLAGDTSTYDGFEAECSCQDLACWEKATSKGITQSLQCTKQAALTAGILLGPGLLQMAVGFTDVAKTLQDEEIVGFLKAASGETAALQKWVSHPKFKCFNSASGQATSVLSLPSALQSIGGSSSPELILSVIKANLSVIGSAMKIKGMIENCSAIVTDPDSPLSKKFAKLASGLAKIGIALNLYNTIKDCGYGLTSSGHVLISNTQCLVSDIQALLDSQDNLDRQHQGIIDTPAPNGGDGSCNQEPLNCNGYAMKKYGSLLRSMSDGFFTSRASFCADACGIRTRPNTCNAIAKDLFKEEFSACGAICETPQCATALGSCISYCCKQEGKCVQGVGDILFAK